VSSTAAMAAAREAPRVTAPAGTRIRVLFDAEAIAARNLALAQEIKASTLEQLLVIAVLKGSFIFAADLIRALHSAGLAPEVEFVSLSSYREATSRPAW